MQITPYHFPLQLNRSTTPENKAPDCVIKDTTYNIHHQSRIDVMHRLLRFARRDRECLATRKFMIETTVLDFKLSNTFDEYRTHMYAPEQQAMFEQMGVRIFYIGISKDDPSRATVMFQGSENVLYDIFMNPDTKPIVEASGHIYDGTVVTRWLA